jgi:probable biosynthetic protein (TIGR04098 family)
MPWQSTILHALFAARAVRGHSVAEPGKGAGMEGPAIERDGALHVDVEIGMPLTGKANLAETPLLKLVGDIRWKHIAQLLRTGSKQLVDDTGQRLYATFFYVEVGFPEETPMAYFGENDRFTIVNTLKFHDDAIADGYHFFYPADWPEHRKVALPDGQEALELGIPFVRTSNAFVRMVQGASWLKKASPVQLGRSHLASAAGVSDSYNRLLKVSQEDRFRDPPAAFSPLTPGRVRHTYAPDPDRDLNGVGLLYFANYSMVLDVVERAALTERAAIRLSHELLDWRTVVRRESAFLCNIVPSDSIEVLLEAWIENPFLSPPGSRELKPIRLFLNYEMYRRSDGRKMLVSTAEKMIFGKTLEDAELLGALEKVARQGPPLREANGHRPISSDDPFQNRTA